MSTLITELKGFAASENLVGIGEVLISFPTYSRIADVSPLKLWASPSSSAVTLVAREGNFVNSSGTNIGTSLSISTGAFTEVRMSSGGSCVLKNKYGIRKIDTNDFGGELHLYDLAFMSRAEDVKLLNSVGELDFLNTLPVLADLNIDSDDIYGNINNIPSSVVRLTLKGKNIEGFLSDINLDLIKLIIDCPGVSGSLSEVPRTVETLLVSPGAIGGNIANLPPNIKVFSSSSILVNGSLDEVPSSINTLYVQGTSVETNNIATALGSSKLPSITKINVSRNSLIQGNINTLVLASTCTALDVSYCPNVTGSAATFAANNPNCTLTYLGSGVTA